jgi:hypothetical protein
MFDGDDPVAPKALRENALATHLLWSLPPESVSLGTSVACCRRQTEHLDDRATAFAAAAFVLSVLPNVRRA